MKLASLLANPSWLPPESIVLGFSLRFKQCKVEGSIGSFCEASQEVILEKKKGNNGLQCGCSDVMRLEDGKLHSHLEWPYPVS